MANLKILKVNFERDGEDILENEESCKALSEICNQVHNVHALGYLQGEIGFVATRGAKGLLELELRAGTSGYVPKKAYKISNPIMLYNELLVGFIEFVIEDNTKGLTLRPCKGGEYVAENETNSALDIKPEVYHAMRTAGGNLKKSIMDFFRTLERPEEYIILKGIGLSNPYILDSYAYDCLVTDNVGGKINNNRQQIKEVQNTNKALECDLAEKNKTITQLQEQLQKYLNVSAEANSLRVENEKLKKALEEKSKETKPSIDDSKKETKKETK